MQLHKLHYGESITTECLESKCNFEFELTLEPKAVDMTERERFGTPSTYIRFCPFCGVEHLNINYEYGDEPPDGDPEPPL